MTVGTPSSPQYLLAFQVFDKRWYWLKAFALATIKDWEALEKFQRKRDHQQAYARIGMAKEAADAAAQANDGGELLERFRKTFSLNAIFDTLKMPSQGVS